MFNNFPLAIFQARHQHESYVKTLREIGLDVIELPPDEAFPDCAFVEDTAVVCNGSVLICNSAKDSRQGEVSVFCFINIAKLLGAFERKSPQGFSNYYPVFLYCI